MKGRRLADTKESQLPHFRVGDYWKLLDENGEPLKSDTPSNLTGTCWYAVAPMSYGYAIANLRSHTVREHEDGTISVRPGDGSSNSILVTGRRGEQWHGYIEKGEWVKA